MMNQPFKVLEPDEIAALLNCPKEKTDKGIRDRAILAMLFSTGMRVSELVNTDMTDIKENRITIIGKRKKYRLVLLSDVAKERLNHWLQIRYQRGINNPALFTTMHGKKGLSIRTVQEMVKRYAEWVNLPGVHVHTLRHCFAVDALRNGADVREVQAMLGHSSLATTQIYLNFSDRMIEEAHRSHHNKSKVYINL